MGKAGDHLITYILFLMLGIFFLILFLKERVRGCSVKAMLLKATTSVMFLAAAVLAAYTNPVSGTHRSLSGFVISGLFFGLLGDIWLDLKYVYPKDDIVYTYAGFSVFGIGHILYISGMLLNYAAFSKPAYVAVPLMIGIIIGILNGMAGRIMALEYGKFKPVVMAYGAILFMMTLLAGSLAWQERLQNMPLNLLFAGGVLFLISDLILSGTYFGKGKDRPVDIITNHIFYYAAQFVIAASILFVR